MKLTEEEIEKRRERIILTAFELFCKRGIESVSMAEIAKSARVGETTLYRYFETKTNLVSEAFVKLWDFIMSHLKESILATENYPNLSGYEQIATWVESLRSLYQNNADFILFSYEAKFYLVRNNVKLNRNQQDILMHAIRKPCMQSIEKGKADGSILKTIDSEDVFYVIWGAIRGFIVKIVIYDRLYSGESPWKEKYDVLKAGILRAIENR